MNEILPAIERLRQAAEGDKPKRGHLVIGAILGAKMGGVAAHASHPWPTVTWEQADEYSGDDWEDFADEAEGAVTYAYWPA